MSHSFSNWRWTMPRHKPPQVTDEQRHQLEAALLTALLLLYGDSARQALKRLGIITTSRPSDATIAKLTAYTAERAQQVQDGVNQRLHMALQALPDDATGADALKATQQARSEIDSYNNDTLLPFIASYAFHQGLIDTYQQTDASDAPALDSSAPGQSAADAVLWTWQQNTGHIDDCTDAETASPASYAELTSIATGPPPVHQNCQCELTPNGP